MKPTHSDDSAIPTRPAATGSGDPWAWHRRTLRGLHTRLSHGVNAHRREADDLLSEDRDDHGGRVADDNEIETLLAEARSELKLLEEVEAALGRLAAGSYGRCEESGLPIPAERLRALPWTRFTREVAARREKEGGAS